MAKTKKRRSQRTRESADPRRPERAEGKIEPSPEPARPGALALAVALAAAHGLWSLFQWEQLILARRGGDYFCGLGEADACANVWDLPLASAIHGGTGLPVAAWGLVWSVVAFALPLWALVRRARGLPLEPVWSATLLTVLAGIGSVVVLGGTSFASSEFCSTCVITYALVLAYASVCFRAAGGLRPAQIQRGTLLAVGTTLVAFLALLYPGLRTPRSSADERTAFIQAERATIEVAKRATEVEDRTVEVEEKSVEVEEKSIEVEEKPIEAEKRPVEVEKRATEEEKRSVEVEERSIEAEKKPIEVAKRVTEVEDRTVEVEEKTVEVTEKPVEVQPRTDAARLEELIARLSPELRQGLSDALAAYARGDRVPLRPARLLIGPSTAPVRITEFTDVLCSHCAQLHETNMILREMLPPGSFALEPRQFPLDSECNPAVPMSSGDGVRCLAARAMICLEEDLLPFAGALFASQRSLTTGKIYDLAAPFMPRKRLQDCVTSPETNAKLQDDITWALQHEIPGTPLLLVNGREVPPTLQFIYAMVLAEANPEHPAFAVLPPPQPQARLR